MEVAVIALVPVLAVFAAITWIVWQVLKGARFLLVNVFGGVRLLFGRLFRFVRTEIIEVVQFVGAIFTLIVLLPLTLLNFVVGRWSTARHYGRAVEDEFLSGALGLYRMAISNPLRFLGLSAMLEGLERRLPEVVDRAPRRATKKSSLQFDGYDVVGTLPAGGSGAQLYLAKPQPDTFERLGALGRDVPSDVVIKSFALVQGSTLPQIVRESRALEAANRLGLVLEHHLDPERFFYVMEYVKGDDLDLVGQRLHQRSGPEGLGDKELGLAVGYAMDVLKSLDRFHTGGLWHKDVKPSNVIVSADRAHLVDFGLVTPLQSALTLTTHGTEYYRDPEMVRLAMQGVKVHEVDGVKFDLYSSGALLYSLVEDSFPAHGSLSQITKRCPETLAWIVRRSMADIDSRYRGAWEMLDDLAAVAAAPDPFALRPADLPSVKRGENAERATPPWESPVLAHSVAAPAADEPAPRQPYLLADQAPPIPLVARRRRRRRMIAAGIASLLFLGMVGSIIEDNTRPHGYRQGAHAFAQSSDVAARELLSLSASERGVYETGQALVDEFGRPGLEMQSARSVPAAPLRSQARPDEPRPAQALIPGRGPSVIPMSSVAPERTPERSASPQSFAGARAMVLDDVQNSVGRDRVRACRDYLEKRGAEIVEQLEIDAGVALAVGTSNQADLDARSRLQEYLDASHDLDVIIWVSEKSNPAVFLRSGFAD